MDGCLSTGGYTVGEIVFLLSLDSDEAVEEDSRFRSCLAQITPDGELAPSTSAEYDPVPTFARWSEVHGARYRVMKSKLGEAVLELRLAGYTERELAPVLGISQPTVHRHFRARLAEIIVELGGVVELDERTSSVPACLLCAQRPRARLAARTMKVAGRKRLIAERQSSLCRDCHPSPELLVPARTAVNQNGP